MNERERRCDRIDQARGCIRDREPTGLDFGEIEKIVDQLQQAFSRTPDIADLALLLALGGRYTLDRAGLTELTWVDLRVVGLGFALAFLAFELDRIERHVERQARSWTVACKIVWRFVKNPGGY